MFSYTSSLFLLSATLLLLFTMAGAEEDNNINFPHRETIGTDDSPDCVAGLGVNFPGYYSVELLPVDKLLPAKGTGATSTTTANPINTDVVSTEAGRRRSTSGYPVDWSAVADAYYRSMDVVSIKIPSPSS